MDKGAALLAFLKATATIRRKRISSYGSGDKAFWLADVPKGCAECRSPFLADKPDELAGLWLQVRKRRMPVRPPVPEIAADWVQAEDLDQPEKEPALRPEITVLVERHVQDHDATHDNQRMVVEEVPDLRRLADHPEVGDAWLEYLVYKWEPWAEEMRRWQEVQTVYESLDFMRRRIEEAEERYELLLAVGLLQWRDATSTAVTRHLLTAPAELTLDAARGLLTVVPAASFDRFRVELDMLELQHRPRLNEDTIDEQIEALDIQAWDAALVDPLLREIANSLRADAQVEETFQRADRTEERPRISFAPAIVLRERRPTAYEDLIRKFLDAANRDELEATQPWLRLLREGEAQSRGIADSVAAPDCDTLGLGEPARFLFPLATNEEQRQIIDRLQSQPCVLVKGPPGTGKSHTIANLICHLLANGDRVLVTAHAPKALAVLRGLLPDDVRDLSVTALGSSRVDQRLLEESVRGILRRKNEWCGSAAARRAIGQAESDLRDLEGELAKVERDLRAFREAETYPHELPGGYSGTAAQIARTILDQEEKFRWFPGLPADAAFPLDPSESGFLAEAHACFTADTRAELELELGAAEFCGPDEFNALIARLMAAGELAERASRGTDLTKLELLEPVPPEQIRDLRDALHALTDLALRVGRVLADVSATILEDLLAGAEARWTRHAADSEALLRDARRLLEGIGTARVEVPDDIEDDRLRTDVERRLAHFEQGGRKGFSILAPRVVRETRYVEFCRVGGREAQPIERLRYVRDHLELQRKIRELQEVWGPSLALAEPSSSGQTLSRAEELTGELKALLEFFRTKHADSLATGLGPKRTTLASASERDDWPKAIDALLASREVHDAKRQLEELLKAVRGSQTGSATHPCLLAMEQAIRERDVAAWRTAWQERERVRREKQRLARYDGLLEKLEADCPGLGEVLRVTADNPDWQNRVRALQEAWAWAAACAWLRRVSDASAYEVRVQDYHRVQRKIEKTTENLVSLRAWHAFFDRLDEKTVQSLNAWTRAVDRIGKGTGKHAYRHRRTARQYLMECVPKIPAWVMPLHKLWDSVDAVPGLFDTVIVDEASQAGVDALALLLLAKRVIVVGDEKQNSPEAVGVLEDDIARLAREHLGQFRFRDEFRPDTSLFDHSERTFGSHITLREHFRCVPEIIRFSNDLCYRDAPLIPLRQAPPDRLPPLRSRFIAEGTCEGTGSRIRNHAEAEALVEAIASLAYDEAYERKTMGVIALQGHAQAELIETLLAQRLDPKMIEDRRLRCGEPATFQGDQRDIIFLSLVIAPNVNYRALARLPDQRRFNVAMSRARDQVWLFHSVRQHDLGPEDLRRRLVSFFESPQDAVVDALLEDLDRLEQQARGPRRLGNQPEPYESWFEVDVALELIRRKFRIRPQVDVAGRRIDLVVEGLDARLAVECDGDHWHGPARYDHDMARQRQLERANWTFERIRESDFYADRQRAIKAVVEVCEKLGIRPLGFVGGRQQGPPTDSDTEVGGRNGDPEEEALPTSTDEEDASETDTSSLSVGPFTGYSEVSGFPDPREASPAKVREVLRQIISHDGPITRYSTYRLYVEGCPSLQRVGKIVLQSLNRALGAMLRAGEIVQEDELRDGSPEGQVLRLAGTSMVKVRPAGRRDLLEIPPSELLAVLRGSHRGDSQPAEDGEAVCRALLESYGFSRLTKPRREYLSKVLRLLCEPRFSQPGIASNETV